MTTTDERRHLVYELLIQNVGTTPLTITGLDVSDPDRRRAAPLQSYRDAALAPILLTPAGATAPGVLAPAEIGVAFIDLALPNDCGLPRRLAHVFTTAGTPAPARRPGPVVAVIDEGALGPPLHGENLLDLGGCCASAHTRALFATDGGFFLSQRYAIDFVRLTEEGSFHGDPTRNESYFLYGADVIAAAPGRIVEVVDGMAENVPTEPLPPFQIDTAAGNHIVEALDDGRFALYAHLKPGSIRVAVGATVRRGQTIGLVGNTGNSTEPHLHFHVTDGPAVFASNGLPYVFDRFDLVATIDLGSADPAVTFVPPPNARRARLPLTGDVVTFR